MILLLILIITEILTLIVIRQHFYDQSWMRYYFLIVINTIISLWVWILWFKTVSYNGLFDEPVHIWLLMSLNGAVCAVVIPKAVLNIFHFSGVLVKRRVGGHHRVLTNTGLIIAAAIFLVCLAGTLHGRYNFKTENFTVKIPGLKPGLEGLKIVHISDLHLSSFHHQRKLVLRVMDKINKENPDLIINTGDFVTAGWREFDGFDTILKIARSRYGNFAVLGNHDAGTYDPFFTGADKADNLLLLNKFVTSSGYRVLNDESVTVNTGRARVRIAGITTRGRFPHIFSGDLNKALAGVDSSDISLLLIHDPNFWETNVRGKSDVDITFAGHTHGMQIGIVTKKFAWSPASHFYPRWNGLYSEGVQFLSVNRGLGVLGIPFRIWMPPQISVITLAGR